MYLSACLTGFLPIRLTLPQRTEYMDELSAHYQVKLMTYPELRTHYGMYGNKMLWFKETSETGLKNILALNPKRLTLTVLEDK